MVLVTLCWAKKNKVVLTQTHVHSLVSTMHNCKNQRITNEPSMVDQVSVMLNAGNLMDRHSILKESKLLDTAWIWIGLYILRTIQCMSPALLFQLKPIVHGPFGRETFTAKHQLRPISVGRKIENREGQEVRVHLIKGLYYVAFESF